ncbi:hypothetical protein CRENBAI_008843 [Crenichthys baileyi]|uniref:Peptidase A2 domain-containing protein n=1 Tax=Crenichthys baileyi TaxID=28760 RepID=A0AAV9RDK3_9TELE
MPMFSMMVMGEEISFVVDSGATHFVLSAKCIKEQPKLSGRYVHSVSASGETVRESFSVPLKSSTPQGEQLKHSVLVSPLCPFNVMGRDLMLRLNIAITSNPDGLTVHTQKDFDYDYTALHWAPDQPLYAYKRKLPFGPVPQHFVTLAVNAVTPDSDIAAYIYDLSDCNSAWWSL